MQSQYCVDLMENGSVAFFASAGFGKTCFLETCILSLALKNTVRRLHFYILDFGNNGLAMYRHLPHVADYIQSDDSEKLDKFIALIRREVKERKKKLTEYLVQNIRQYNKVAPNPMVSVVLIVDYFDIIKEMGTETEEFFASILREGMGLGIYMIITATKTTGVRYTILNGIKLKIAGYLFEESEIFSLVGRGAFKLEEVKGRCLVKNESPEIMQLYLMGDISQEQRYREDILGVIQSLSMHYAGEKAPEIPILPKELNFGNFGKYLDRLPVSDVGYGVLLGLDVESIQPVLVELFQSPFLVIGDSRQGKTNVLAVMLEGLLRNGKSDSMIVFDSKSMELFRFHNRVRYIQNEMDALDTADFIVRLCAERKSRYSEVVPMDYF